MGKLRWYKRDPNAALVGMRVLSCEERGAYNTLLDLIYANDGSVIDDDRYLAGECALSMRGWRRVKARLVELRKIYAEGGRVKNFRADAEVRFGLKKVETARVAGEISARKKRAASNENKGLPPTAVGTTVPTESTARKKDSEANASGAKAAPGLFADAAAPKSYATPKDELWGEGVPILLGLGAASERTVRDMIGKWLKETGNNASAILNAIRRAKDEKPIGAIGWVTRAIQAEVRNAASANGGSRATGAKQSHADAVVAASRDRADRIAARIERERGPADGIAPKAAPAVGR
jgi:uncharacterized protein YdaU (DUF1376 family)